MYHLNSLYVSIVHIYWVFSVLWNDFSCNYGLSGRLTSDRSICAALYLKTSQLVCHSAGPKWLTFMDKADKTTYKYWKCCIWIKLISYSNVYYVIINCLITKGLKSCIFLDAHLSSFTEILTYWMIYLLTSYEMLNDFNIQSCRLQDLWPKMKNIMKTPERSYRLLFFITTMFPFPFPFLSLSYCLMSETNRETSAVLQACCSIISSSLLPPSWTMSSFSNHYL